MANTDIPQRGRLRAAFTSRSGFLSKAFYLAVKQPIGAFGLLLVFLIVSMGILAPVITPHDPVRVEFSEMLLPPSASYLLGTDQFGRDILTRLLYGAQTALFVGCTAAFVGSTAGLVLGVTSAYLGGRFDLIFQRVIEVFQAFPLIIMALAIVSIFGPGVENVIIAITIPFIPDCARVVRSSALALRHMPYVDAARANGFSTPRIVLRHIVPNVMAPYLIMITTFIGHAILLEASLS